MVNFSKLTENSSLSEMAKSNTLSNTVYAFNMLIYVSVLLTTTIYVKKLESFCLILQSRNHLVYIQFIRLLVHIVSFQVSLSLKGQCPTLNMEKHAYKYILKGVVLENVMLNGSQSEHPVSVIKDVSHFKI